MKKLRNASRLNYLTHELIAMIPESRNGEFAAAFRANEKQGMDFMAANAQASLQLWLSFRLGLFNPTFRVVSWHSLAGVDDRNRESCEVNIKLSVAGKTELYVSEGNGPVNALDRCFAKGLEDLFPDLGHIVEPIKLVDYETVDLDKKNGSGARMQVSVYFSNGEIEWKTLGAHSNILIASCRAMYDAYLYPFFLDKMKAKFDRLP